MAVKSIRLSQSVFNQNFKNIFFYSAFFPLFTGMIAFSCWLTNLTLVGLAIFVALACYLFVSQEDLLPVVPMLFYVIIMFRDFSVTASPIMYGILAPAVICILIHVFKYRYKPNLGKLFFPLIIISCCLFLGGLFSPYLSTYLRGLPSMISVGPVIIIVYLFFLNYIHPPKQLSLKTYFSKCLIFMVLFACLEFAYFYYNQNILHNKVFLKSEIGWANINNIGTLILMAVPLCFYLMVKTERVVIWLIVALAFCGFIILLSSSAVFLAFATTFPFVIIYTYFKLPAKSKLYYKCILFSVCAFAMGFILTILAKDYTVITKFVDSAINGRGREDLYNEALSLIKRYPLFGAGLGYYNDELYFMSSNFKESAIRIYNFHSTFLHIFATMGIVGVFAYIYYYIQRIRIFTTKPSSFSRFGFASFMGFSIHGMLDTCEFNVIPLLIVLTMILVVTEIDSRYPLFQDKLYRPILKQ